MGIPAWRTLLDVEVTVCTSPDEYSPAKFWPVTAPCELCIAIRELANGAAMRA
jgi:hypothetical protein